MIKHHVHKYWFRFSTPEECKVYKANFTMFRNKPLAGLVTIAIERAEESYQQVQRLGLFDLNVVKEDSLELVQDSYMDDIHIGGSQSDENCMMGELNQFGKFTGTIPRFLDNVGHSLKTLIQSGSTNVEANQRLLGCALGYLGEPGTDIMGIKFEFNTSKSIREFILSQIYL